VKTDAANCKIAIVVRGLHRQDHNGSLADAIRIARRWEMEVKIGKGLDINVDVGKLVRMYTNEGGQYVANPIGALEDQSTAIGHAMYMGLRNILMDSHASVTANTVPKNVNGRVLSDAEHIAEIKRQSLSAANKKLVALYSGEVRTLTERAPKYGAVEAEARLMALVFIQKKIKKEGKKLSIHDAKWYAQYQSDHWKEFEVKATKIVAIRNEDDEDVEDVDELMDDEVGA
jgi:hypothetical protein